MLNQTILPAILILTGFIGTYFIQKDSKNVSTNLTLRRGIAVALLVFLAVLGLLSGDVKPLFSAGVLGCIVLGRLFLRNRVV